MNSRSLEIAFLFFVPICFTLAMPYSVGDLAVWIAHGEYFLTHGSVLRNDIYSVLPTQELVYPSFGISIVYAWVNRIVGLVGVCLFHALFVLPLLLYLIYRSSIFCIEGFTSGINRIFIFGFWLAAVPTFVERSSMVALIWLILTLTETAKVQGPLKSAQVSKFSFLTFLWVNTHGSFILLPALLAWRILLIETSWKEKWKDIGKILFIAACSLLNPFGWKVFPFIFETASLSRLRQITEWDFPSILTQFPTGLLYWTLIAVLVYSLWKAFREGKLQATLSHPFFLLAFLGMTSIRNAALTFVCLLPFAKDIGWLNAKPSSRRALHADRAKWAVGLLAVITVAMPFIKKTQFDETALFRIKNKILADGRTCAIFNSWEVGSFFILEVPNKIWIDTRNIIYTNETFQYYENTLNGAPDWNTRFTERDTCFAVIHQERAQGLIKKIRESTQWEAVTEEKGYLLFAKKH